MPRTVFAAELRRQIEFQQELRQHLDLALVDGVVALLSIQLREVERSQEQPTKPVQSPKTCPSSLELDRQSEANLVRLLMAVVTADGLTKNVELRRILGYFQEQLGYTGEGLLRVEGLVQNAQEEDEEPDVLTLARPFLARPVQERIAIYSACIEIAFADDEVPEEEQELLTTLAELFQIGAQQSDKMHKSHAQASAERQRALELKVRGQYPVGSPMKFDAVTESECHLSQANPAPPFLAQTEPSLAPGTSTDQPPPCCTHCGTQARKLGARFCYSCGQTISLASPQAHPEVTSEARSQTVEQVATQLDFPQVLEKLLARGKPRGQLSHDEISEALSTLEVSPDQFDEILERFVNEGVEVVDTSESDWMTRPIGQDILELQAEVSKIAESWQVTSLMEMREQVANRPKGMNGKSWERLATFVDVEEQELGVIDGGFVPWTPEWGSLCARVHGLRFTVHEGHLYTLAGLAQLVQAPPARFREAQRMALVSFLERLAEACGETYLPTPAQPGPVTTSWTAEEFTAQFLQHLRSDLKERHWQILSARFGLDGKASHTLEELGKQFGLTRERVRQIEGKALQVVRRLMAQNSKQTPWRDLLSLAQQPFWPAADLWDNLHSAGLQRERDGPVVDLLLGLVEMYFFEPTSCMTDGLYFRGVPVRELSAALSSLRNFFRDHCEEAHTAEQVAHASSLDPQLVAALLKVTDFVESVGEERYTTAFSALNRPEQAFRVLRDLGEPSHYETIARMMDEREGVVEGVSLRTVTNYMVGDERFVCQGRSGFWGLAEWGIESRGVRELMAEALQLAGTPLSSNGIYKHVSAIRPVSPNSVTAYLSQDSDLFFRCGLDEWGLKAWEDDPNYADRFDLQIRDLLAEFVGAESTGEFPLHEAAAFVSRRTGMSPRSARAVLIWSPYLTIWREGWQRSRCRFHLEPKPKTRAERNRRLPTQQNIFDAFLADEMFNDGPGQELILRDLVTAAEEQLGYPSATTYTLISRSELLEKFERGGTKFCRLVDLPTS